MGEVERRRAVASARLRIDLVMGVRLLRRKDAQSQVRPKTPGSLVKSVLEPHFRRSIVGWTTPSFPDTTVDQSLGQRSNDVVTRCPSKGVGTRAMYRLTSAPRRADCRTSTSTRCSMN